MIIHCISDLHGYTPELKGGDLLILAGDYTASDKIPQWCDFFAWLKEQPYRKKILIAGNHDGLFDIGYPKNKQEADDLKEVQEYLNVQEDFEYLCDYGTEFEGLNIWGSPWTPTFYNWHFMKDRGNQIKEKWDLIPSNTDILITHGPPLGILDQVKYSRRENKGRFAGCEDLRNAIDHRLKKLKLHVFGHVHEGYGKVIVSGVTHVNASIMDEEYRPVNKPIRIIYENTK